jgi:hypothetical protein
MNGAMAMTTPSSKFGKDTHIVGPIGDGGLPPMFLDLAEVDRKVKALGWTPAGAVQESGQVRPCIEGLVCWGVGAEAHEVHGGILAKYLSLGGPTGWLGYPTTDETDTPDGAGRFNQFERGTIFWSSGSGACEVHGQILASYLSLGGPSGPLGYPTTDESGTSDGAGRFNQFEHGSIYYASGAGAHEVHGEILAMYLSEGGPTGWLGYPTSDEIDAADGRSRHSRFERGLIYWTKLTGAFALQGDNLPSSFESTGELRFVGDTPVGGSAKLIINDDGSYVFAGSLRDSGTPDFKSSVVCLVVAKATGKGYLFPSHNGKMSGTFSAGSRNDDWNESGKSPALAADWLEICAGQEFNFELRVDWNPGAWIETIKEIYPYVKTIVEML